MAKPRSSPTSAAADNGNGRNSGRLCRRKRPSVSLPSRKRKPRPQKSSSEAERLPQGVSSASSSSQSTPSQPEVQQEKAKCTYADTHLNASSSKSVTIAGKHLKQKKAKETEGETILTHEKMGKETGPEPDLPFSSPMSSLRTVDGRNREKETRTEADLCVSSSLSICGQAVLLRRKNPVYCKKSEVKHPIQSPLAKCLKRTLRKRTNSTKVQPISHQETYSDNVTVQPITNPRTHSDNATAENLTNNKRIRDARSLRKRTSVGGIPGNSISSGLNNKKVRVESTVLKVEELSLEKVNDPKQKKGGITKCIQKTLRNRASTKGVSHQTAHCIKDKVGSLACAAIDHKVGLFHSPISKSEQSKCKEMPDENVESLKQGKGWTNEQVVALQNAYFEVLPSSKFWFEVSKKVTGKTAKECFDRYYSSYPTPPATQSHGRRCASGLTMRTISFTNSPMTSESGSTCHFGRGKQGLLKAHQTVRTILRKQKVADGSYEADVFSTVEKDEDEDLPSSLYCPDLIVPSPLLSSSVGVDKERGILNQLQSPEVLKRETNPTRLDRYLDMLHLRRADKKNKNVNKNNNSTKVGEIPKGECVRFKNREMHGEAKDEDEEEGRNRSTSSIGAARDAIIIGAQAILERISKEKEKAANVEVDESGIEEDTTDMSDEDLY